jgi:hypothetical protein
MPSRPARPAGGRRRRQARRAVGRVVVVLGLAGASIWPAAVIDPARAAGPDCVALVVDPAPGGARTGCVTWTAGITGMQVLRAGHTVQVRPTDGLICRIDGAPATCAPDANHYWSYWHRPAGGSSWAYSNEGAATYHPARNSSEGWAYQNGGSRQPANIAFSTICPPPAPAPRPTRSAPRTSPPPPTRATSRPPAGPGSRSTGPAGSPAARSTAPAARTSAAAGARSTTASRTGSAGPTGSPGGSALPPVAPVAAEDRGGGAPVGVLLGLLLVAAVAGTGVWFARARRAGPG